MWRIGVVCGLAAGLIGLCGLAPAQNHPNVLIEEFLVPAKQTGIQLYVRNKHIEGQDAFGAERTLLFVHGEYPAESSFDLPVDGMSWMDFAARQGFDVYLVDVRGYGKSTWPTEMDAPSEANAPIVNTETAIGDVASAIDFILRRRGLARLNLLGWAWGTAIVAGYAAQNPEKVRGLSLYAPLWLGNPVLTAAPPKFGAYRSITREAALEHWLRGAPADAKPKLIPPGWFDAWWNATIASDPVGAAQDPRTVRAPNGDMYDLLNYWLSGRALYDPAKITAPTMLILAEWDQDTPTYMAEALFPLLKNVPRKRLVIVGEGTHTIMLEKNRMTLVKEVQAFLEEDAVH